MATIFNSSILNSAILDSAILHKTLTQTSSIWLKLIIHSDSTWWWQPSWILPSWILPSWIQPFWFTKKLHSFTLTQTNLMMAAILNSAILDSDTAILDSDHLLSSDQIWLLPSWIQPFCTKLWLKLVQSDSNSFILTQLDDGSHLEFCHLGFRHCHLGFKHLVIFSQIHSKTLFLHSDPDSN